MAPHHTRSLSFSSINVHPTVEQFDEQLSSLRYSQNTSTTSSSSLSKSLVNLKDLYCSVDELLQLSLNQQAISKNLNSKWTEEVLRASLRLLDICSTSRDVLVQSKECLQVIQSVLKRRSCGELNITKEVAQYLTTRKRAKKLIKKSLKNIKESEQAKKGNSIESMLSNVNTTTLDIFKSVLSYIGGSKLESPRTSKWSMVTKLMNQGTHREATPVANYNDFDGVDATLESLIRVKSKNGAEDMRNQMMKLQSDIQSFDQALDSLFNHLIKTRATILNILSN